MLLATSRRQQLLEHIWQRTSLSRDQFGTLYRVPIERYTELVQQFPASENHHHAYHGGMLDHGLEIVAYALKLRQSYLLPVGADPETQAAQTEAWTAAVAYAALLHDIGKIAVDLHVECENGEVWHPWHGKLMQPYRFRYRRDRLYRLHGAATGLLYTDVLDTAILDWLHGFPELWASLLFVLAGHYEHAGTLGELVLQADQASVAQELGGDPAKARTAPKQALQRKLLDGLRYLLKEELKLNQSQASDGWLTQDSLWLVSKTVCDKLRAHLLSQGIDGVPDKNTAVFNVLQDHGIAQATPEGKAIWKATVVSHTGWTQSFTFLKLASSLIWDIGDRPASFEGTVRVEENISTNADETHASRSADSSSHQSAPVSPAPTDSSLMQTSFDHAVSRALALFDDSSSALPDATGAAASDDTFSESELQVQQPSPQLNPLPQADAAMNLDRPPGVQFMAWLRNSIQMRRMIINDAKALVHTVAGTAFLVSPGVFQRYAREHPEIAALARQVKMKDWQWAQKNFEKLRLHKKQANGLNIWTCEVTGPRKRRRLHGYLLTDKGELFAEVPFDNPYLTLLTTSVSPDVERG